ncbi:MAG: type II secretion system ATPase GspE [Pseudomonadota bacterium]
MSNELAPADPPSIERITRFPYGFAQQHGVVLLSVSESSISVGYRPDAPPVALQEARRLIGPNTDFQALSHQLFDDAISRLYQSDAMEASEAVEDTLDLDALMHTIPVSEDLLAQEDDAPVIRLINALLSDAVERQASDIHIETFELTVLVRFRIDGVLREILQPKRALAQVLVSRIKIMAQLDIAEKRVPQDGRITIKLAQHEVDIRVSTIPTRHGERVVLRLLDRSANKLSLSALGMNARDSQSLEDCLTVPHGIILVTGPTGSGKTTTLYAGLAHLNDGLRNILTVEDPVEYDLGGIGQTQVNSKSGMTFARGLRAILRQDPDVVMIGEIRDQETADIAVQASLTGHLVLSTLHTNTAVGALARLVDMGIEPYLLASSLTGVMAQRLVRVLCTECRRPVSDVPEIVIQHFNANHLSFESVFEPVGCDACHLSGYKGRTGIYELVRIDAALRHAIHTGASDDAMTRLARESSPSIEQDGWRRVVAGTTSIDEVMRVTAVSGSK